MTGWNGSGTFVLPYDWEADAAAGINILASRMETQDETIASQGFGNTLTRDGQGQPTANLPMAGFKHTGAAAAVGDNDYVIKAQITGAAFNAAFISVYSSTSIDAGGNLNVNGVSQLNAGATINTGGLAVAAGGATITAGGLVVQAGGAGIAGGLTVATGGLIVSAGTIALSPSAGNVAISPTGGTLTVNPGGGGTMNNVVIGGTVPAAATFTTVTVNNPGTAGNQAINFSQFPATQGSTGTMTLPSGVIEKWGTGSTSLGVGSVSFAVSFPTACDNVQLTIIGGSGAATFNALIVGAITSSGFAVYGAAAQSVDFHWRVIGR